MIPFLKPIFPSIERYYPHLVQIHADAWYSNGGQFVQRFEKDLQNYLQTDREIVLVSNATLGLMLAIKGLQITGKVLVPSFTFAATVAAIRWCNLEYEYIDISDTWCADPACVEEKLKSGEYGAIMPVHALGLPCDVKQFELLSQKYKVKLIFDAASAIGASYNGRPMGNFGDIEVFSLHATKCLPIGEGGFLSIKNSDVAQKVRQLKNFGFANGIAEIEGLNAKLPEVAAAIGIEALKDLKQHMRNRRGYVQRYKDLLEGIVEFQKIPNGTEHGYQVLSAVVPSNGHKIVQEMAAKGIQIRQYFTPPLHKHPAYKQNIDLPKTTDISERVICLPLYSVMDEHTIDFICQTLKRICYD